MFRYQIHVQVRRGKGTEYCKAFQEIDRGWRAKKLPPSRLWNPVVGKPNDWIITSEFETVAAWHAALKEMDADAENMRLWRASLDLLDETPWSELLEETSGLA